MTGAVLHAVFNALAERRVMLEGMLLKPNMVTAGPQCSYGASVPDVAAGCNPGRPGGEVCPAI